MADVYYFEQVHTSKAPSKVEVVAIAASSHQSAWAKVKSGNKKQWQLRDKKSFPEGKTFVVGKWWV